MDVHHDVQGIKSGALKKAHQKDLKVQDKYGVNFKNYWYDKKQGKIFCLCEAPSRKAAESVHREAHGGVPDEIFEVKEGS